jgi:hypothetical protein
VRIPGARQGLGVAVAIVMLATAAPLRAQDQPPPGEGEAPVDPAEEARLEQARTIFREGIELVSAQQFEEAAVRFEAALALHDAPAIRYNLASALFETARPLEAADHVRRVLADTATPIEIRIPAQDLAARIEAVIGRVHITVVNPRPQMVVTMDGEPIADDAIGTDMPVMPGAHTFAATLGAETLAESRVELRAGQTQPVELRVPTPREQASGRFEQRERNPIVRDWRLWTGIGAGVVLVVLVTVLAVTLGGGTTVVRGNYEPGVLEWP